MEYVRAGTRYESPRPSDSFGLDESDSRLMNSRIPVRTRTNASFEGERPFVPVSYIFWRAPIRPNNSSLVPSRLNIIVIQIIRVNPSHHG